MTYRYPYILVAVFSLVWAQGCQQAPRDLPTEFFAQHQNPYFPLGVGNRWVYAEQDSFRTGNDRTLLVEATRYLSLNDRWYIVMRYVWYAYGNFVQERIRYWTYGENGQILMLDSLFVPKNPKDQMPELFCDFKGDLGMQWPIKRGWETSVSLNAKEDSVLVGDRWYRHCVSLLVGTGLDSYSIDVYAKSIGLVRKERYCLQYYEIHDPADGRVIIGR